MAVSSTCDLNLGVVARRTYTVPYSRDPINIHVEVMKPLFQARALVIVVFRLLGQKWLSWVLLACVDYGHYDYHGCCGLGDEVWGDGRLTRNLVW
jgi:hypothetical protein